jgi:hypothetical protein
VTQAAQPLSLHPSSDQFAAAGMQTVAVFSSLVLVLAATRCAGNSRTRTFVASRIEEAAVRAVRKAARGAASRTDPVKNIVSRRKL